MPPTSNPARSQEPATISPTGLTGDELFQWLTPDDVAKLLQVSPSWVYEHTRARGRRDGLRLPFVRFGKYVRFNPKTVAAFLAEREQTSR